MHPDAVMSTFRLSTGTAIAASSPWYTHSVTLDSPALDVMTDLTKVKAATIPSDRTLRQAEQAMIYQGVRMLFVVDEMPLLQGLITSTDLYGERQMSVGQSRQLRFDELRVADVMTPLTLLDAIGFERMGIASVGNLVATLKEVGRNHLLVVERGGASGPPRVRGVISRAQIERQLGRPIEVSEVPGNFAEVVQALR
jgi:CBS-domain-containing membrane protein